MNKNDRNEVGEGNWISLTSQNQDFPVPKLSISTSDIEHYCLMARKKKLQHFISFPDNGNLTSFSKISGRVF